MIGVTPSPLRAEPRELAARAELAPPAPRVPLPARSVGSPTDGSLEGGVPVKQSAELRLRWPAGPRWGLPELVSLLERAALAVDRQFPGSILLVGDLSRREGGSLSGHVSHESGRDADVGFYYSDERGRSVRTPRLLPVTAAGTVPAADGLRFDEARNWALIEAFLRDSNVSVQRIFIAERLERRLLDYARRQGIEPEIVERAAVTMQTPGSGSPHDNHLHVRIACPEEQEGVCISGPAPVARRDRTAKLEPRAR